MNKKSVKLFVSSVVLLAALNGSVQADMYDDAVANSARSDKDKAVDERRMPAEVMRYFEIQAQSNVLDVFAGGGYYTEMLSYLVGTEGAVTLYNNSPWDDFVAAAVKERLADDRLPNVERLVTAPESLVDLDRQYDSAMFILGWHDVYYADDENNWPLINKEKFLAGIFKLLKEGAVFGVIDANAESGANNAEVGKSLHRVDPQVMIDDMLKAGFVLESRSDLLSNPDDDKTSSVFLPANRYRTDRSVLKFRKPTAD